MDPKLDKIILQAKAKMLAHNNIELLEWLPNVDYGSHRPMSESQFYKMMKREPEKLIELIRHEIIDNPEPFVRRNPYTVK